MNVLMSWKTSFRPLVFAVGGPLLRRTPLGDRVSRSSVAWVSHGELSLLRVVSLREGEVLLIPWVMPGRRGFRG